MKNHKIETYHKDPGQILKENVICLVIVYIFYNLFGRLIDLIFKPFKTCSDEDYENISKNKQRARNVRRMKIIQDSSDPMYQFYLRFFEDPDTYEDSPENDIYEQWYNKWLAGNIIDSDLRWAPVQCFENEKICDNFLRYMKIQFNMHKKSSFFRKFRFCRTLKKYYPEFSSSLKGLESDLSQYEKEISENDFNTELYKEAEKFGLSKDSAEYLITIKDPEKFKTSALLLKKYESEGYESEVCVYAVKKGLDVSALDKINEVVTKYNLPIRVGAAYASGALLKEDVEEMSECIKSWVEEYNKDGIDITCENRPGSNKIAYDEIIDEFLKSYRVKK